MRRFTKEHEWVDWNEEEGVATMGITEHAAEELGDITFVELPDTDVALQQGDVLGVIESVKAAADIYAAVGGTVCAVNEKLEDAPELINEETESDGWICKFNKVQKRDFDSLMDEEEYDAFLADLDDNAGGADALDLDEDDEDA
mgnify:CR=1 FL=1